jgi:hypothetical protein
MAFLTAEWLINAGTFSRLMTRYAQIRARALNYRNSENNVKN